MLQQDIIAAVRDAFREHLFFANEEDLHRAIGERLTPHTWKPSMRFAPALHPVPGPSDEDERKLAARGKSAVLDVCEKKTSAELDLLWHTTEGPVALELKFRNLAEWSGLQSGEQLSTKSSSDAYGWGYLLDLHRMERVVEVRQGRQSWQPVRRFALFVTNDSMYWTGVGEGQPSFRLIDGTTVPAQHHAAYSQPSEVTRWVKYPPFRLANSYPLAWQDVGNDVSAFERSPAERRAWPQSRLLLLEVQSQP